MVWGQGAGTQDLGGTTGHAFAHPPPRLMDPLTLRLVPKCTPPLEAIPRESRSHRGVKCPMVRSHQSKLN